MTLLQDYPATHWYQCRLLFSHPLAVNASQVITGALTFTANDKFSYCVDMEVSGTINTALAITVYSTTAQCGLRRILRCSGGRANRRV
jgi:hypothetical protein